MYCTGKKNTETFSVGVQALVRPYVAQFGCHFLLACCMHKVQMYKISTGWEKPVNKHKLWPWYVKVGQVRFLSQLVHICIYLLIHWTLSWQLRDKHSADYPGSMYVHQFNLDKHVQVQLPGTFLCDITRKKSGENKVWRVIWIINNLFTTW